MPKMIMIEGCNFIDYPRGGQLSFCTQMLSVFPEGFFKLVGITTDPNEKVGVWQRKIIEGKRFEFFPVHYIPKNQIKGLIPDRFRFFISLIRFRKSIFLREKEKKIITHAPETLIALYLVRNKADNLHFLHGVENPLNMPRFKWGKIIRKPFWGLYIRALSKVNYVAATADEKNINEFISKNKLKKEIVSFPTRFDDLVFKFKDIQKASLPTFVYCGRINLVKGWELLIQSFFRYINKFGKANLIVVGDGEDRQILEIFIKEKALGPYVTITGFLRKEEVSDWLNSAHVFLLPSYKEGWPIALLEALACGLSVVVTNVSGVQNVISAGQNGFIVDSRNPEEFANAMFQATHFESPNMKSLNIAANYKLSGLKESLINDFPKFFENDEV